MSRVVVLGGGESGVGSAVLAKVKGYSDQPQQSITIALETPRIDEKQLTRLAATPAPQLPDNMP